MAEHIDPVAHTRPSVKIAGMGGDAHVRHDRRPEQTALLVPSLSPERFSSWFQSSGTFAGEPRIVDRGAGGVRKARFRAQASGTFVPFDTGGLPADSTTGR
jgi:hypothetical protein